MTYRNFAFPEAAESPVTTQYWLDWMRSQGGVLLPVPPHHDQSCQVCFGACAYRPDGSTWPTCWNCHTYDGAIDTFVPITYSIDAGLESMLHRYKDRGVDWLRRPLASLLTTFIREHAECIDHGARGIDLATVVPSDNASRSFNHLHRLLRTISGDRVLNRFEWNFEVVGRNKSTARPGRGELKPSAYRVGPESVDGTAVLLFDDTWTSGSSAASTAAALKNAGALHVTVLTLGRQLNVMNQFGSTAAIYEDRHDVKWAKKDCILCA